MSHSKKSTVFTELRGGIESSIQGISSAIGPVVFFMGLFGAQAVVAGFWATLVTASVVCLASLLIKGQAAIIPSSRTASLAAYAGLVLHLSLASGGSPSSGLAISMQQLRMGLAAGSLMFLAASAMVLLSGLLKFGNVFKMIPAPVTAGISNGTALLIGWLAVKQMSHHSWTASLVAVGMVASYFLWPWVQARVRAGAGVFRFFPTILVALGVGIVLTLLLEPALETPVLDSSPGWNWMSVQLWPELRQQDLGQLLAIGLPGVVALALVMVLETFTAISVMESRFGVRSDANRELLVMGGANIVSAVLGGVPSTGSPLRSVANWTVGGRGRVAYAVCLVFTSVLILSMGSWLMALPVGIVVGLLLLQMPVMADRMFIQRLGEMVRTRRWSPSGATDLGFWITLVISLVGFFGSLIWACLMGIGLSTLAVLRRVSSSLTAQWEYLDHYRSRRMRSDAEISNLTHGYHRVGILRLTGHLFFGNSARLMQLIDELHEDAEAVVIDASGVHDVDPSGLSSLVWLIRALVKRQLTVVVTGLKRTNSAELRTALESLPGVLRCIDLDRGLEACEDHVLLNSAVQAVSLVFTALENNGLLQGLSTDEITEVLMLGDHREVPQGSALFYKDAAADGVWLLEEGAVSILSGDDEVSSARLATFGPGRFVGEMGFIDGKARSATARADTPVRALLLDKEAIATLMERQPAAAMKITRNIARELSNRVRNSSALVAGETSDASIGWANSSLSTVSPL